MTGTDLRIRICVTSVNQFELCAKKILYQENFVPKFAGASLKFMQKGGGNR